MTSRLEIKPRKPLSAKQKAAIAAQKRTFKLEPSTMTEIDLYQNERRAVISNINNKYRLRGKSV